MKISGKWLSGPVQQIFAILNAGGHQVYAVGGCVRNDLIGEPVNDVDLATDAVPDRVTELLTEAGLKVIPTGIDHGTVTVPISGEGFEITTFRQDVETDGRHAVVAFSDDIMTDARRRDFTMNALYADQHGNVVDPLGGLSDIQIRKVRFIDDPDARIREDGLRILRFFRFFAAYGDPTNGIDVDGLAACASNLDLLTGLSAERITSEIRKLLASADPTPAVSAMEASGVLASVMPGATSSGLGPLVHSEDGRDPHWIRRLAAIGGLKVASRMRLSKAEIKATEAIGTIISEGVATKPAAYLYGSQSAIDAALILASISGTIGQRSIDDLAQQGAEKSFPVAAKMLLDDIPPGPELGATMKRLEKSWIDSDFSLSKEELLKMAKG